jgi:hypothetical protein
MRTLLLTLVAAGALAAAGTAGRLGDGRRQSRARQPDGGLDVGREDHDPAARPDAARGRVADDHADRKGR